MKRKYDQSADEDEKEKAAKLVEITKVHVTPVKELQVNEVIGDNVANGDRATHPKNESAPDGISKAAPVKVEKQVKFEQRVYLSSAAMPFRHGHMATELCST